MKKFAFKIFRYLYSTC